MVNVNYLHNLIDEVALYLSKKLKKGEFQRVPGGDLVGRVCGFGFPFRGGIVEAKNGILNLDEYYWDAVNERAISLFSTGFVVGKFSDNKYVVISNLNKFVRILNEIFELWEIIYKYREKGEYENEN